MFKRILGFIFLSTVLLSAAPTSEQLRVATLDHIRKGTQQEGIDQFTSYLSKRLNALSRVPTRELGQMAVAADCVRFMQLSQKAKLTDETAAWILDSGTRLHQLIDTLAPEDRFKKGFEIIDQLRTHDPAGCDEYFDLILAIALVMDHPGKVRIHEQMGQDTLLGDNNAVKRYDYFKTLYAGGDAKIAYETLTAAELRFVVHVPVPISELEWVRENVRSSLSSWGDQYSSIEYDHVRLQASRYTWDTGPYQLSEIQKCGGICVDQAYYAVMTARAYGIPAIYFHGSGKSANHAWFAYMKSPGDWLLDIGRYQGDEYTTGHAIDPQTRLPMTDHDVEYACEHSLHSSKFTEARIFVSIAEVLLESDPENALHCARQAREKVKRYLRPWEIEQQLLTDQKDYEALVGLFADKKDVFGKYPDILTQTAKEIEAILRKGGRNDDADRLLRSLNASVDDDRDDLKRSFEADRINQIIASGDMKKARKELEQLLDEQKDGGNKVFHLIRGYIELTQKTEQTHEAVKFMEDYIEKLIDENDFSPGYEQNLLLLLHAVYKNDGETQDAAKVMQRIERLNY